MFEILIQKNNVLTDGNIPDRKVTSSKLINVIYHKYEKEGSKFKIKINDLCEFLNMTKNSGKSKKMIMDSIKILQAPIELRNFEHEGREIQWCSLSFLTSATIYKDYATEIEFEINPKVISFFEQHDSYTAIDLKTSNKFSSKYAIVIWEMYCRYKNQQRKGVPEEVTYQDFSIEDLNKKFGTNFTRKSEMKRVLERGLNQIEKKAEIEIFLTWEIQTKKFRFFWKRDKKVEAWKTNIKDFITHIRSNFINVPLMRVPFYKASNFDGEIIVHCSAKGLLYHKKDGEDNYRFNKKQSEDLWKRMFENRDRMLILQQAQFNF